MNGWVVVGWSGGWKKPPAHPLMGFLRRKTKLELMVVCFQYKSPAAS